MAVDLSGLKDIHIPEEPSWWPPALGWWLVLIGGCLFIMILVSIFFYWYTRPKQYAIRALQYYYKNDQKPTLFARHLSALLKRIALLQFPRKQVAQLTDEEWIDFLLSKTGNSFSEKQLQFLSMATYMPEDEITADDPKGLYLASKNAILKLFERKKNGRKNKKHS